LRNVHLVRRLHSRLYTPTKASLEFEAMFAE
jgi:hypothetical protein